MNFQDYLREIISSDIDREKYVKILQKACIDKDIGENHIIVLLKNGSKFLGDIKLPLNIKRNKLNIFLHGLGYNNQYDLIKNETLLEEFLDEYISYFEPSYIIVYQNHLSECFFEKHANVFSADDFNYLIPKYIKLSKEFINKYAKNMNWDIILKYQSSIDEELIENNIENISEGIFRELPKYVQLSNEFIDKYSDKLSWWEIFENQNNLSRDIVVKNLDKMKYYEKLYAAKKFDLDI